MSEARMMMRGNAAQRERKCRQGGFLLVGMMLGAHTERIRSRRSRTTNNRIVSDKTWELVPCCGCSEVENRGLEMESRHL